MPPFVKCGLPIGLLFLLVFLLSTASAVLDDEERQKQDEARESVNQPVTNATQASAPDKPENVVTRPLTSSSIEISWDPASGAVEYHIYKDAEDTYETTDSTSFTWKDLEACTDYIFKVRGVSAEGEESQSGLAEGTTLAEKPPAPQDLTVKNYTASSVTITWTKPDTSCKIIKYNVKYYDDPTIPVSQDVEDTLFSATHLKDNTTYTFEVNAYTSEDMGPAATVDQTTDVLAPPPENVNTIPLSSSSILISWKSSSGAVEYHIYKDAEDTYETTDRTSFTWKDLEACTDYVFQVRGVSAEGEESASGLAKGTTLPEKPPAPQDLTVKTCTASSVTITWTKPDTSCKIEKYNVKYYDDPTNPVSQDVEDTLFSATHLKDNTTYTFEVNAYTSEGMGPAATVDQTTDVLVNGPPINVRAEGISPKAINVTWTAANNNPKYYTIEAAPCFYTTEGTEQLFYVIDVDEPCTTCSTIIVTSHYNGSETYSSDRIEGSSLAGSPPPPTDCSTEVKSDKIILTWKKPTTNCHLGNFRVTYTWEKLWGDRDIGNSTENTTSTLLRVYELIPYASYTFTISSSIDDVFGSGISCSCVSQETLPGPPVISEIDSGDGKVQLSWEAPVAENGLILNYGIYVDDGEDPVQTVAGDIHTATVNLPACTTYSIAVAANNSQGWSNHSEKAIITVAGDVLPDMVDCTASDGQVTACWEPHSVDCPVSKYVLSWTGVVLWSDEEVTSNTEIDWTNSTFCYDIPAKPYSKYSVDLKVGTKPDIKKCSATTPMAAPGPPTIELQTDSLAINVSWKEPVEKNGIIELYRVVWTNETGPENSNTADNETRSYQILGVQCGGEILVTVSAKTEDVKDPGEGATDAVYLVNSVSTFSCSSKEAGKVLMSWEMLDPQCTTGQYNVTVEVQSRWSDYSDKQMLVYNGGETSAQVTHLHPYSYVTLQIHVDNAPEYKECITQTIEEPSSAPRDLKQIANGTNMATLSWAFPEFIRGQFSGWNLAWILVDGGEEQEKYIDGEADEITIHNITGLSPSRVYSVFVRAMNGAGSGEAASVEVATADAPPVTNNSNNLPLILGASIGGGLLLILLVAGGFVAYKKTHTQRPSKSAPFMPGVVDGADSDDLYKKQHFSSANQRYQDRVGTVDLNTTSEPHTIPTPSALDEHNDSNEITGSNENLFNGPGNRRFSEQVTSSLPKLGAFNRRPSQQPITSFGGFDGNNGPSSGMNSSQMNNVSRPSLGDIGRRSSQQLMRPNLNAYGRRPSQQVNLLGYRTPEYGREIPRHSSLPRPRHEDFSRRLSEQRDLPRTSVAHPVRVGPPRPRLEEFGRRPSQQIELRPVRTADHGRRPSQQIGGNMPHPRPYDRRHSHQIEIGKGSLPALYSHKATPRDLYSRRASQQADIGRPSDRAFVKRPSQQFMMNFAGIPEN